MMGLCINFLTKSKNRILGILISPGGPGQGYGANPAAAFGGNGGGYGGGNSGFGGGANYFFELHYGFILNFPI